MLTEYEAEGWAAFNRGEPRNSNPHRVPDEVLVNKATRDWDNGWRLAREAAGQNVKPVRTRR